MHTELGLSDPKLEQQEEAILTRHPPQDTLSKKPNKNGLIQCSKDNPQLTK